MPECFAASSQAPAFESAACCVFGVSGPICPWSARMIQAASVVWVVVDRRPPESGKETPTSRLAAVLENLSQSG